MKRNNALAAGGGIAALIAAMAVIFIFSGGQCGGGETTHGIYYARYIDTPSGPVAVVVHGSHTSGVHTSEPRYDHAATTTMQLYGHRVADGAYVGSQSGDWVTGAGDGRFWIIEGSKPRLVDAETMKTVADQNAIAEAIGGDFELTRPGGFANPYNGWLAVKMADGKQHWVTPQLERRTDDQAPKIPPEGWYCSIGRNDLLEPRMVACLPPAARPATQIAISKQSALKKDEGLAPLVSGVSASSKETKVLWSKSLVDFVDGPDQPSWLGAQALGDRRVMLMLRTGDTRLHLVTVDATSGSVLDRKELVVDR